MTVPIDARISSFELGGEELVVVSVPLERDVEVERLGRGERAVAALIARGLGNGEIARQRGTSVRTVANQVAALFRKLGVSSRVELAARLALVDLGEEPSTKDGLARYG